MEIGLWFLWRAAAELWNSKSMSAKTWRKWQWNTLTKMMILQNRFVWGRRRGRPCNRWSSGICMSATFGFIHRPSSVHCFWKARMAWRKHKEDDFPLPDPVQFAERFSGFCDQWNDFMVGKLLGSIQQMNSAGGTQSRWFWKHLQKTVSQTGWMEKNGDLLPQEDLSSQQ